MRRKRNPAQWLQMLVLVVLLIALGHFGEQGSDLAIPVGILLLVAIAVTVWLQYRSER